jgi:PhnB protein
MLYYGRAKIGGKLMKVTPYLTFAGHCEEAMTFYASALSGKITMSMTFAEMMGEGAPEGLGEKIAHMTLDLGEGSQLFASDVFDESDYKGVEGVAMSVTCANVAEAETLFGVMSEGGMVTMPLAKTDWAELFGMCRDRFGVGWMIDLGAG